MAEALECHQVVCQAQRVLRPRLQGFPTHAMARLRATAVVIALAFTDLAGDIVDGRRRSEPDCRLLSRPAAGLARG